MAVTGSNSTADRAIEVLLLFDEANPVMTASEVSQRLVMTRSTTYRYLHSLRARGLVEEDPASGGFRLGTQVLELARVARKGFGLSEVALPCMRDLNARTGETILLTRRSGFQVVCLEAVVSPHPIRLSYERGHILPPHAGASAKILLAFLAPPEIDRILDRGELTRYTDHTVTNPGILRRQLDDIRKAGYAVTNAEVDAGVRGIAAPIFGSDGQIAAGLSVAGPASRLTDDRLATDIDAVKECAGTISRALANAGS